jgi:ribosomal-protein-alanine N-acetyltransferase
MDFELRKWKKTDVESFFKYSHNTKIVKNMRDSFPSL